MLLLSDLTELKRFEGDGLGGLGFDTLSDGYPTLIDNLYSQNLISKKVLQNFNLGILLLHQKYRNWEFLFKWWFIKFLINNWWVWSKIHGLEWWVALLWCY